MTPAGIAANILLYQTAWIASVLGASAGHVWPCVAGVLAALLWHLARARAPARELKLILIASAIGAAVESSLVASGWVQMRSDLLVAGMLPLWLVALWAAFATTLNVSLRALRNHYGLAAGLGFVGAPLAYATGARLGALHWVLAGPALALIAVAWALSLPVMLHAARRHDGYSQP